MTTHMAQEEERCEDENSDRSSKKRQHFPPKAAHRMMDK
jgi:hypothetical protein